MWLYYGLTLGIYGCLNGILALGFNLQFGQTGIMNLAFFLLVAVGAYMTSIAGVGPPPTDGVTHYIGGFGWAFPWDLLFGVACTVVFALVLGGVALHRLRNDYLALTLVAIGQGFLVLATNDVGLFNGYGRGEWCGRAIPAGVGRGLRVDLPRRFRSWHW